MNDPAAPDEHPPYWGSCAKMNFGQLRKFIDAWFRRAHGSHPLAHSPAG